jgi:DNA repair exonuclease SbcCD ATPase subunit
MYKYTITRFLVTHNAESDVKIVKKEVNKHAPINRVLDRVGYFAFQFVKVGGCKYLVNFEENERGKTKSKLLISRCHPTEERLIGVSKDDLDNVVTLISTFMNIDY